MTKDKIKTIGQLILDILTAVWLVVLSFIGTSCISSSGDVSADISGFVSLDPVPIIEEVE